MRTNPKVDCKSSHLFEIINTHLGENMNLARIKCITQLVFAMCKVQTVGLHKLAIAFETEARSLSSMKRIQRFLSDYILNLDLIARIIFNLLPKRGNSNTLERKQIMERFIRLFGKSSIQCLVADREFVGEEWLAYLNREQIPYHIRIRENFRVKDPRTGKEFKAWWMFNHLKYRLFAVMTIAFLWAYLVGIYKDVYIKPIRILNNGRRAKSIFKYGLEEIAEVLQNPLRIQKFSIFQILSCA